MKQAIIDLSAIYRRYWHMSEGENVNSAARKTLAFVRRLYEADIEIIVALDAPPYKRKEVYPEYKANREPMSAAIKHELDKTIESIRNDGWKIARCQGYEADDVIATLVKNADCETVVYGTDKDLLQCTDVYDIFNDKVKTPENTLNVSRDKVVDYLTLCGDSSDNIKGVKLIGPKKAVDMLGKYGTIKGIYDALLSNPEDFTPATTNNLQDAMAWIDTTRSIIVLSDDLDLEIEQKEIDRTKEVIEEMETEKEHCEEITESEETAIATVDQRPARVVRYKDVEYKNSLEPMGIDELWRCSNALHQSQLYEGFATPQGIMAAIMHGREIGMGAAMSVSSINVIKGKPSVGAEALVAMVKASSDCEYLQCTERTPTSATWVTKRRGSPKEISVTFTMEDARAMGKDNDYNYKKQPAQMLMWRAASIICRMEYPDKTKGMMSKEEMQ